MAAGLRGPLDELALIDHHCHGIVAGALDRVAFEALATESFEVAPRGTSHFDSPVGLAIRRWCAPVLDVEPLAPADDYLVRRAELGPEEVHRRLLRACGLEAMLVESGYRGADILDVAAMGALAGVPAHEVVRLEAVAESVAERDVDASGYAAAFEAALEAAAADAVGLKTIVAYRGGFAFDPSPPSRPAVAAAAGRWLGARGAPLTDPVLLRFGIWTGAELARSRGLPLQFHCGYGDPDITLHLTDPSLLTTLLKELLRAGVDVALLHCYPFHRQAAYLAAALPNVYVDVGLALNYTGPSSAGVLGELMEAAPFTKHLYSSDAFGLAELHYLGAVLFRRALSAVLDSWIGDGQCSAADAERIAELIGRANARRLYHLDERS